MSEAHAQAHEGNGISVTPTYSRKFKTKVIPIEETDGTIANYVLRSLDGPGAIELQEMREQLISPEGKAMPGAPLAMMTRWITMSLMRPDGKFVEEGYVLTCPREMQQGLFLDVLKINGIDPQAQEAAKNA